MSGRDRHVSCAGRASPREQIFDATEPSRPLVPIQQEHDLVTPLGGRTSRSRHMVQPATSITRPNGVLPKRTARGTHDDASVLPASIPDIELLQAVLDGLRRLNCEEDNTGN